MSTRLGYSTVHGETWIGMMNLTPSDFTVSRVMREEQQGHHGLVIWFTGLSGSGKSTLARAVEEKLHLAGCRTFILDGDNVRLGLCRDLGFSASDRRENIRRVGEMAKLFLDAGVITLAAFISPFADDRQRVRALFPAGDFLEIYCNAPVDVCEARDVKGLYKKARQGLIPEFTGVSSAYQAPVAPELSIDTARQTVDQSVSTILALLQRRGFGSG